MMNDYNDYNITLTTVTNHPCFKFLEQDLWVMKDLVLYAKDKGLTSKNLDRTANCVYIGNTEYYLAEKDWAVLYETLVENTRREKVKNETTAPTGDSLELSMEQAVKSFIEEDDSFSRTFKKRLDSKEQISKISQDIMQILNQVMYKIYTKKEKTTNIGFITIKRTVLSTKIGVNIIAHFVNTVPFVSLFSSNFYPKDLDSFVIALFTNDKIYLNNIYKSKWEITDNNTIKLLNNLIKYFIIQNIDNYTNTEYLKTILKNINILICKDNDSNNFTINEKIIEENIKEHTEDRVKIGSFFIDFLIKKGWFKESLDIVGKEKNPSWKLTFTHEADILLSNHYRFNKPFLVEENFKHIKIASKERKIDTQNPDHAAFGHNNTLAYKMLINEAQNIIHYNPNIKLKIHNNSDSEDFLDFEHSLTSYAIDRGYFIFFLKYLGNLHDLCENDFYKFTEINEIDKYLCIFNLEITPILSFIAKDEEPSLEKAKCLNLILRFSIDYDTIIDENLGNLVKSFGNENVNPFVTFYNRIVQGKISLKNTIRDCVQYFPFKYHLQRCFIDARGRLYNSTTFMNIQNNPIAKMFIKLFVPSQVMGSSLLPLVFDAIKEPKLRAWLQNAPSDIKDLWTEKESVIYYHIDHMKKYFNSEYTNSPEYPELFLDSYYKNKELSLDKLFTVIKKKKRLFIIHSQICLLRSLYFNRNDRVINYLALYHELDAKSSGLQMISILHRSSKLAFVSNLTGSGLVDIYSEPIKHLDYLFGLTRSLLADLKTQYPALNPQISTKLIELHEEDYLKLKTKEARLEALLNLNMKTSTYTKQLITRLETDFNDMILSENFVYLEKFIPKFELNFITKINLSNKNLIKFLLILRHSYRLEYILNLNPSLEDKAFKSRDLFKKAVMTYFYNSTSYGRKEDYIEHLREYSDFAMENHDYEFLGALLDILFLEYKDIRLQNCVDKLTTSVVEMDKPIVIVTRFYTMTIYPQLKKSYRFQTRSLTLKRGPQLSIEIPTSIIDKRKLKSMFLPNFIHSMDAMVVHLFRERLEKINNNIKAANTDIYINYTTNHDTFIMTTTPALLIYILQDCYYELYKMNYLTNIQGLKKEEIESLLGDLKYDDLFPINYNFMS